MVTPRWTAAAALLLAMAAASCRRTAVATGLADDRPAREKTAAPIPQSREADDVARFLAGLPGAPDSPYLELEQSAAWRQHRKALDDAWKRAGAHLLSGLAEFQREELNRQPMERAAVFYPFSGPDAITPLLCFPHSERYVLVALEPAGTLPAAGHIGKKNLPEYLAATRTTMASILGRSFFVTREMDRQFRGQVTDGLMLPILELLVRTGHTVLGFRYVRLDEEGRLVERAADYHAPGKVGNKGIEIEYRAATDRSVHRLCYLSVNLANDRLRENTAFSKFAATLKGSSTLLKATSYMLHQPEFSTIRDLIVQVSGTVLQDDSGIPYRYFSGAAWRVQLYGAYQRPYGSFRWMEQKDLRAAYGRPGVKPLPVEIGYGYRRIASNMLLAERQ
ncbi:MAG TPA: hypothetical protein VKE70_15375 [Candidatus Solibacter sp.]|nr:hypothetical protein [Candidatus Solibacter sp.]